MATHSLLLHDPGSAAWLLFGKPIEIVEAFDPQDVCPALERIRSAVDERGLHAAGAIAYEAAPAFDRAFKTHAAARGFPLLWFGLYRRCESSCPPPAPADLQHLSWNAATTRTEYGRAIAAIKERIVGGDTYQVNYSMRLRAPFSGDPWQLFLQMLASDAPGFSAYLDLGRFAVCSVSPELFFKLDGDRLLCRPMKGTVRRGRYKIEDDERARWLESSGKNRAENVMIVDMIRNDLGRIATTGGVSVERLFDIERYPTVWQMTSTVSAKPSASFPEIMAALFPCASITGAPKVKTMEIIADLETAPRGIYTGAIGYLGPGRRAQFSVAIRTAAVDRTTSMAEYGVGGGILFESEAADEYEECLAKSSVLTCARPSFSLLETLRWTKTEGYFLIDLHMQRMEESAAFFGYRFGKAKVLDCLNDVAASFPAPQQRVRLLLNRAGEPEVSASMPAPSDPNAFVLLAMASAPVDANDVFLFHKTTNRSPYERAWSDRRVSDDVVLWNERDEITETTSCNIVAEIGGRMITPARSCGLLAGTFRRMLLDRKEIAEGIITRERLAGARRLWVINSVRGMRPARLL